MKEMIMLVLVFILISIGSCAEGDWGEINEEEEVGSNKVLENENISVSESDADSQNYEIKEIGVSENGEEYTINFYVALALGMLALLIIALFIYLFMREPKNKWKK